MSQLVLFGIFIVVIIVMVKYAKKMEQQRSESLAQVAKQLGYQFESMPSNGHYESYRHFQLFTTGRSRKTKNLISNHAVDKKTEIFGYQYTTSNGKNSSTHRHSVVSFTDPDYKFPDFDMRPEHIFHRIGGVFGYQDIDFDSHPEFSKKYLLQGRKETTIRKLFTPELMKFLEKSEALCLEARGNTVIIYQQYKQLRPEEILKFYQDAQIAYKQFCLALGR